MLNAFLARLDDLMGRLPARRGSDWAVAVLLLAPGGMVLLVFGLFPLAYGVVLSLYDLNRGRGPFVGLQNYATLLQDEAFWKAVAVTAYYTALTIPPALALSFLIASALFRLPLARGFFRTVYFLPFVTSVVAAATVWRTMLNPQRGLVNTALGAMGLERSEWPRWLLEPRGILGILTDGALPYDIGPSLALVCVSVFTIWHSAGFMIVVFLAGLSLIPRELEEAARLDGANWWRTTRHVTLPLLSPTIFFLLVVSTIRAFQAFDHFYALTGDGRGPLDTTQTLTVFIFTHFYEFGREGYGASAAAILTAGIVALTLLQWRAARRWVHYE